MGVRQFVILGHRERCTEEAHGYALFLFLIDLVSTIKTTTKASSAHTLLQADHIPLSFPLPNPLEPPRPVAPSWI